MTYQIIITEETAANIIIDNNTTNVSVSSTQYPITINYNAVIEQAGGNAYGNSNVAAYLASSSLNGNIITSANISGAYILGNGSQLTGLPATYGNANVANFMANFGSNAISTTGNITANNLNSNTVYHNTTGVAIQSNAWAQLQYSNSASAPVDQNSIGTGSWFYVDASGAAFESNTTGTVKSVAMDNGGNVSATGNITGSYFLGNGSQLTGITSSYGNANVAANLAAFATNPISTSGNITAGYFLGNGSQLTGIASTYGNANVANFLANFGANTVSTTGNITAGNINTTNYVAFGTSGAQTTAATGQMFWDTTEQTVSLGMNNGVTQQIGLESYILVRASSAITDGQVVMFTGAAGEHVQAAPANMASAGFRPGYVLGIATQNIALNSDGYVTVFGTVHDINTNAFNVGDLLYLDPASTTGGLTATEPAAPNYHIEIGTVTKKSGTGHVAVRLNVNDKVSNLSDVTITSPTNGQVLTWTTGNIWKNATISAANISGTVANATYALNANAATFAGTVTTAAQPNITSVGNLTSLTVTGNTQSGNLLTGGLISATGNITGNYHIGNGSLLSSLTGANVTGTVANATYATSAGSATTATTAGTVTTAAQGNITSVGTLTSLAVTGNTQSGNLLTGGLISATGNIIGGNLVIVPGTGAGNIDLVSSQAFTTVTTTNNPARIIFGSGYTGNADSWSVNYDPYSRMRQAGFLLNNRVTRGDGAINTTGMTNIYQQEFTANVTTATSRNFAAINFLHVGGGASAFRSTVTSPAAFVGQNSFVQAGTNGNVAVGNTVMTMATGGIFGVQTNSGATIGNAIGVLGSFQASDTTGNVTNAIGFSSWPVSLNTTLQSPTNFNSFYHPSGTAVYGGLFTNNAFRAATNYYAFKNDDNVAQVQLGSLRSYNEFQYSTATTGTVNIDKNNAQVQFLNPTANVTIGDFQNFVTTANDSVNNDNQTDTVTLIIQQGATPYTVTMPTGNASIKYAGGVSTIGTTANAVTVVTVSAVRSAANASLYLASVSSEFS